MFTSSNFIKRKQLTMKLLSHPILVYNVDGMLNEPGSISEAVDVMMRYHDHSKLVTFMVTSIATHNLILGLTWLQKHNPEVDWAMNEVKMSHCPNHCCTCQSEVNAE